MEEKSGQSNLLYYKEVFETPFLAETGQYYRGEASGMVVSLTCSQYMKNVVARLQGAQRTGSRFLHQTSVTKVRGREGGEEGPRGEAGGRDVSGSSEGGHEPNEGVVLSLLLLGQFLIFILAHLVWCIWSTHVLLQQPLLLHAVV